MFKKALICVLLAFTSWSIAQSSDAQKQIDSLKHILSTDISEENKIEVLADLVPLHYELRQYEEVESFVLQGLELSEKYKDTMFLANFLTDRAVYYSLHNELKTSRNYFERAKHLLGFLGASGGKNSQLIRINVLLSSVQSQLGNLKGAFESILEARALQPEYPKNNVEKEQKIKVLLSLGHLNIETHNLELASVALNEAVDFMNSQVNFPESLKIDVFFCLADLYMYQDEYDKAKKVYDTIEEMVDGKDDPYSLKLVYQFRAQSFCHLQQYDKMVEDIERLQKTLTKCTITDINLPIDYLEAIKSARLNEFDKAIDLLTGLVNKERQKGKSYDAAKYDLFRAEIYLKKQDYKSSLNIVKEVDNYMKKDNVDDDLLALDLFTAYALAYEKLDTKKALYYYKKANAVNDSLAIEKKNKQVEALNYQFDFDRRGLLLAQQEHELELLRERESGSSKQLFFIIILIVMFIIAFIVIYNRQQKLWKIEKQMVSLKNDNLGRELDYKDKQITDFAIHIESKNDLLEKVKMYLSHYAKSNARGMSSEMKELLLSINEDIGKNKEKVELYTSVDEEISAFDMKIQKLFPELSKKERRMAAMIRLEYSSKQIASELNIALPTAYNYRLSMRKKMDIPKDIGLTKFIKEI